MRCLALADRLRERGALCQFISRALPGAATDVISRAGYNLTFLPILAGQATKSGVDWEQDAEETIAILKSWRPHWLIIDHYAFDFRWEDAVRTVGTKFMVIDDLADRPHSVDILLDQNLGRLSSDYDKLLPMAATRLIGPRFALLRPQFAQFRSESLARRAQPALGHVMIAMGGADALNSTGQLLEVLAKTRLPNDILVTVVLGATAPHLAKVRVQAEAMPFAVTVRSDITEMACLMAEADLAIGASGGTAWERSCLGLPSLILVLAANQRPGAHALAEAGAALFLGEIDDNRWKARLMNILQGGQIRDALEAMSQRTRSITDGCGCDRVVTELLDSIE